MHQKTSIIILIYLFLGMNSISIAQLIDLGVPKGWSEKIEVLSPKSVYVMPGFDVKTIEAEDYANEFDKTIPWRFGYNYEVNWDMDSYGQWLEFPNGDRIWRIAIHAPGALSLNVIFDEFYIPKGARMDMYNIEKSHHVGAYTSILNNDARMLGTELVYGDHLIIEYYEPSYAKNQGRLKISTITHGYRSLHLLANEMLKNLNASGACNIDVLCPLGIGWENQIKSVGLIIVNGNSGCSGALINNTANDGRPFFLTANHCLGNPSNWLFRFDWHSLSPSCATTTPSGNGPFLQTSFTSTLRARSSGSDFALVELNNPIPQNWDVYYAGWDRTDVNPQFTVGIHHPAGDIKKICRDDDPATKRTSGGAQVWRIAQWEHGVTEPGSSGSPLFDHNGRIIGQLYGGLAACISSNNTNNNGQYDDYGRLAISWNGANAASRLSDWLDPIGSGISILNGFSFNQSLAEWDVSILSSGIVSATSCSSTMSLSPTIRNLGSNTVTALSFVVQNMDQVLLEYNWTGEIIQGSIITIPIPDFSIPAGYNEVNLSVTIGNGIVDENPDNNESTFNIQIIPNGNLSTFNLTMDCYGSENSFTIADSAGSIILSDGPFPDIPGGETYTYNVCLAPGCYTMTLTDSYGDGLFGAQYNNCSVNGDYNMFDALGNLLFQMTAPNGNFGSSVSHEFCVTATGPSADFIIENPFICEGTTVQYFYPDSNEIVSWTWSFPGGVPSASTDQSPSIFYPVPGIYSATLEVTDGNLTASVTQSNAVTVYALPQAEIQIIAAFGCSIPCTGALSVEQTGGDHEFVSYIWSNGDISANIEGLCYDSTLTVLITDSFGCQNTFAADIPNTGSFSASASFNYNCQTDTYCVQLSVLGGEGPFTYEWIDESITENERCGLDEGSYTITISDSNECITQVSVNLLPISGIEISASIRNETCPSVCDGSIILSGEFENVLINWEDLEDASIERSALCPGDYVLVLSNIINGCAETITFTIQEASIFDYTIFSDAIHCNNSTSCASFEGDSSHWILSIIFDQDTIQGNQICGLSATSHQLILIDNAGCHLMIDWEPEYISDPEIFAYFETEGCMNSCDGFIIIEAISFSTISYSWSSNDIAGPIAQNLCSGIYTITITDINGCTDSIEIELPEGNEIPVIQFESNKVIVDLSEDPTIQFINNSENADEFYWSFGDGNFSTEFAPIHTYNSVGKYLVTLIGFNGSCTALDSLDIEVIDLMINTEDFTNTASFRAYPNPTSGFIFIEFTNIIGTGKLIIKDLIGNEVLQQSYTNPTFESINIGNLPNGTYILSWLSVDGLITKKIIKY
jgi:lysyl endopeptidase